MKLVLKLKEQQKEIEELRKGRNLVTKGVEVGT